MAKPFMRVRLDKPKLPSQNKAAMRLKAAAKPKPMPKPKPAAKLKATAAEEAAVARGNRSQALEDKENRLMGAGKRKAPQIISTTVRERATPTKKK
jgi:hypothetical protein